MRDLLRAIVADKRAALERRRGSREHAALLDGAATTPRDFCAALAAPGLAIVAEIKRRSPSAGALRLDLEPAPLARALEAAGARALSVLTEPTWFGGSAADLVATRAATCRPVLRKDFLLEPAEMRESRLLGADAVLLIVRILGPGQLDELVAAADEAALHCIVEAHDERDLERAIDSRAPVIGINSRDLDTLRVDLDGALALRTRVPRDRLVLAESGVRTPADVRAIAAGGFDAVLVGEALMRASDPAAALRELGGEAAP